MADTLEAPAAVRPRVQNDIAVAVDMNGWHTVAAVTYEDLNAAIKAGASHPTSFSSAASDGSASAAGTFGDWRLTTGGAGPDIVMQIAVTGGSVTGPFGSQHQLTTLPVQPCAYPVTVNAAFIPHAAGSSVHDLVIATDSAVQVGAALGGQSPTGNYLADAAFQQLLQDWLIANISQFNVLFASVDLDAAYQQAGQAWLKPSFKGYAVAEPATGATVSNSIFAVLCLVDGAPAPSNISYAVSPLAIPAGARAAFLISSDRFLQHMLLPAVPLMFQGIENDPPTAHFAIDNDGTQIVNLGDLTASQLELDNGKVVDPTIAASKFTIQLDLAELQIEMDDMTFEPNAGVVIHLNYSGRHAVFFDKTKGVLNLQTTQQSSFGSVEVSQGLQIAEWVTLALAAVAGAVSSAGGFISKQATAAIEGAGAAQINAAISVGEDEAVAEPATISALGGCLKGTPAQMATWAARGKSVMWLGMISSVLNAAVPAAVEILKAIENSEYDKLPKVGDLVEAAVGKTVIWPEKVGTYQLDTAQLAGCLQFGLVKAN